MDHPGRPLLDLRDSGLLWLINRVVFHPRGFALALNVDAGGVVVGWSLEGDGGEVWQFAEDLDDRGFVRVEATLRAASGGPV